MKKRYTVLKVEVRTTGSTTRGELAAVAAYLGAMAGEKQLDEVHAATIGAMSVQIACWEEESATDPSDGRLVRRRVARVSAPEE